MTFYPWAFAGAVPSPWNAQASLLGYRQLLIIHQSPLYILQSTLPGFPLNSEKIASEVKLRKQFHSPLLQKE